MLLVIELPNDRKVHVTERGLTLMTKNSDGVPLVPGSFGKYLTEDDCQRVVMAVEILTDKLKAMV